MADENENNEEEAARAAIRVGDRSNEGTGSGGDTITDFTAGTDRNEPSAFAAIATIAHFRGWQDGM